MKTNASTTVPQYTTSLSKRALDLVGGLILLTLSLPLCIIIGTLVFASSGNPIIFRQKRLGQNKKIFTLYKFRTMKTGAELEQSKLKKQNIAPLPMFKIVTDPRFTRFGYFISHVGLDEIPQLVNVLKNDMSLVGPRPLPVAEGNALTTAWSWRWLVKPGLFSYWVLSPNRYQSLEEWKRLEHQTVQISSPAEDIRVIWKILTQQVRSLFDYVPSIFQ